MQPDEGRAVFKRRSKIGITWCTTWLRLCAVTAAKSASKKYWLEGGEYLYSPLFHILIDMTLSEKPNHIDHDWFIKSMKG